MLISFPGAATFWRVYQASKRPLSDSVGGISSPVVHIAAASIADVVVCSVRNPFEVVKQQLQVGLHKSTAAAVREILRVDGVRGLYAGWGSTVARDVPFDAVQFVMYEYLKASLMRHRGELALVHPAPVQNCALRPVRGVLMQRVSSSCGRTWALDFSAVALLRQ